MGISERHPTERNKKAPKKVEGIAHYENIKPHNPSTEDWYIPADMKEGDYLMMDPACEVNQKGTREKNDGNEVIEEGTSHHWTWIQMR